MASGRKDARAAIAPRPMFYHLLPGLAARDTRRQVASACRPAFTRASTAERIAGASVGQAEIIRARSASSVWVAATAPDFAAPEDDGCRKLLASQGPCAESFESCLVYFSSSHGVARHGARSQPASSCGEYCDVVRDAVAGRYTAFCSADASAVRRLMSPLRYASLTTWTAPSGAASKASLRCRSRRTEPAPR